MLFRFMQEVRKRIMTVLFHIALVNTGTADMLPLCFCYHGTEIMEQIKKLF